jgi:hypothetical protein
MGEPRRVDKYDIILEKLNELLLLLPARASPVAAENKASDTGAVEIFVEQLSEPSLPYRGIGLVVEQFAGSIPELVHKRDGIRWVYRRRSRQQ